METQEQLGFFYFEVHRIAEYLRNKKAAVSPTAKQTETTAIVTPDNKSRDRDYNSSGLQTEN